MSVPEKANSCPCIHCHGDHPDHSCPWAMLEDEMRYESMIDEMRDRDEPLLAYRYRRNIRGYK